jgi:hypothetical protein
MVNLIGRVCVEQEQLVDSGDNRTRRIFADISAYSRQNNFMTERAFFPDMGGLARATKLLDG